MSRSRFVFEETRPVVSDDDILKDLRAVARKRRAVTLPHRVYRLHGRYSQDAVERRFGTWNRAVSAAGLSISAEYNISETALFDNLEKVWVALGRQPRVRDMKKPLSRYTYYPYSKRYGGWLRAVRAFLWSRKGGDAPPALDFPAVAERRRPSLRLRFLVMSRDGFRCRQCGASPAVTPGVRLHVDHIVPWSKGGATSAENLQTLCAACNFGKGNLAPHANSAETSFSTTAL
ncbi:MAG: HNH endonuclease [SAR202 cluster bacterium]|nr:HNH endonuclease [SAR202 cluster bacterium]